MMASRILLPPTSNLHNVSIRLGDGVGGFTGTNNVSVGLAPASVAIGDFNNDGKQDIAAANNDSYSVSIRLGDGAGGFSGTTNVIVGTFPYSVAIGDFNNDGQQDIAVANYGYNTVSIRLGDGLGGFSGTTNVSVGVGPFSVTIGDFNNDGRQDIAAANYSSNTVSIRLGDGSGGFSGTTDVGVNASPRSVAIGDFNADGKQDFAAANEGSNTVSIRLGACNPSPTIAAATGLSRQQGSPAGNSQIATVTDDGGNGSVSVTVTSPNPSNGVSVSNIMNTGGTITADIVADCTATNATFTLQASDGSSTATDTLSVTVTANTAPALTYASPQSVVFGGTLNVSPTTASDNGSITGYAVQAGHGLTTSAAVDSSGVVSITNAQPSGAHTITIRATDNCDAFTDASFTLNVGVAPPTLGNYPDTTVQAGANTTVTPDTPPTSTIGMNVSTASAFKGTFAANPASGGVQVTNAQPAGTYTVTVTAFNGTGGTTTKTFTLTVTNPTACDYLSFAGASGSPFFAPSLPWSVAVGDFNTDGKQDLVVANRMSNTISVLFGLGGGALRSPVSFGAGTSPFWVSVGDFNGDGKQDLATANADSNDVSILLGDGSGNFSAATGSPFAAGTWPYAVVVGDFNSDGKQDLAAVNNISFNVTVLMGDGSGGFSPASGSPFAVGGGPESIAIGDFNGDGKQDLVTTNGYTNNVTVLLGDGSGGFSAASGSPISVRHQSSFRSRWRFQRRWQTGSGGGKLLL